MNDIDYKRLVEAALFMSSRAMGMGELSNATGIASMGTLERIISELVEEYKNKDTALEIVKIDNKYLFGLKEPYASKVSSLASGPDLSKGSLRILAYVSKNNGIMQSQLVKTFGESTYAYVKELTEKDFIEAHKSGRSKKITTTSKFSEYFNVDG
ncbi:MAG: SMC-Scp complex subunit ScpB [Candidatus Marsarchaeota archaeon]|nr:SMC-Scp complex subunit ScpB [Candidatus Marsarchaeota archaeon]